MMGAIPMKPLLSEVEAPKVGCSDERLTDLINYVDEMLNEGHPSAYKRLACRRPLPGEE